MDIEKSVERIGLSDVLTALCPGAVLIASTGLWFPFLDADTRRLLKGSFDSTAATFMLLLLAYAVGLVLQGWSSQGFVRFATLYSEGWRSRPGLARLIWFLKMSFLVTLHGRPLMPSSTADVEARIKIVEIVREHYGESVVGLLDLHNFLYVFRVLSCGVAEPTDNPALNEADAVFRRRGFAQGVALSVMIVAIAIVIEFVAARLSLTVQLRDTIWFPGLVGIASACVVASVLLRQAASKLHSEERIFTYSLLRSRETGQPEEQRLPI